MIPSERNLIASIRNRAAGSAVPGVIKGIGDDCAVVEASAGGVWLVSVDMLVDGVHFNRSWHPPRLLGRKTIAVNLSDIAAMGGIPRFFLLAVSLPPELSSDWLEQWLDGVAEILAEYDCVLIGGDTVRGDELNFSVTVIGERHRAGVVYRNGARVGDSVYVSGPLGLSAAGLRILSRSAGKGIPPDSPWQACVNAHLDPVPQIRLGQALCASGCVSAMQDISDGLATDLSHICRESGTGAVIREQQLPTLPELDRACGVFSLSKRDCLLRGGEDYQLVFTVRRGHEEKLEAFLRQEGFPSLPRVGTIVQGQGVFLEDATAARTEITFQGFEHLR